MHNRDLIWKTKDGRSLKLKDIPSDHLTNISKHIEKNISVYNDKFGVDKVEDYRKNIQQELRMRKLNRIDINNEEELF